MPKLPLTDWFVLAWFCACWVGYSCFARRKSRRKASLVVAVRIYRREWFKHMLGHPTRIAHVAALSSLRSVTTFFASTALVILGGLVALLGTTDRVVDLAADLPFARHDSEFVWLVRIVLLIFIFVYAFFVFTWSIRQYNFCAVLVGAAPHTERPEEQAEFLDTITAVASYAAENSTWACALTTSRLRRSPGSCTRGCSRPRRPWSPTSCTSASSARRPCTR